MYLVRAHTPGTGKSYLVDVIAAVATGRVCPVITASKNMEETDKDHGSLMSPGLAKRLDREMQASVGDLLPPASSAH
jgi:putative DNA primase/helicase